MATLDRDCCPVPTSSQTGARLAFRRPTINLPLMRLIADGAISFAFVPVFEVIALAAVFGRQPHRTRFARLGEAAPSTSRGGALDWFSRIGGVLRLAGPIAFSRRSWS